MVTAWVPDKDRDAMPVTVQVTLTVKDWKEVQHALRSRDGSAVPSLAEAISDAIEKIAKTIYEPVEGNGW